MSKLKKKQLKEAKCFGGLRRCTKMMAKIVQQDYVQPAFKKKRNGLFA